MISIARVIGLVSFIIIITIIVLYGNAGATHIQPYSEGVVEDQQMDSDFDPFVFNQETSQDPEVIIGDPDVAPRGLVEIYGNDFSFLGDPNAQDAPEVIEGPSHD